MRLIIFLIALTLSTTTIAQKKDSKKESDTTAVPIPTDTTGLIQYRDFVELDKFLAEIPAKYANPISNWIQERFRQRAAEWQVRNAKKEQPKRN